MAVVLPRVVGVGKEFEIIVGNVVGVGPVITVTTGVVTVFVGKVIEAVVSAEFFDGIGDVFDVVSCFAVVIFVGIFCVLYVPVGLLVISSVESFTVVVSGNIVENVDVCNELFVARFVLVENSGIVSVDIFGIFFSVVNKVVIVDSLVSLVLKV